MNRKILMLIILGIFIMNLASANLIDIKLNTKADFINNTEFGEYLIRDNNLIKDEKIKDVKLIENSEDMFNAWNIKEITLYKPNKLFDETNYYELDKKTDKSNVITSELQYYRYKENKTTTENNVYCGEYKIKEIVNGTNITEINECVYWENNITKKTEEIWSDWEDYNFQILEPEIYQTKTLVTRDNLHTSAVEWIDTNEGVKLDNWATWWNSSWNYYKEYTNLTGNITYMEVDKAGNDAPGFTDTRFVSCTNESLVFNYTLEATFDGQGLGYNSSISPYDSGLVAGYKFDNNDFSDITGTNNGTNFGTTNTSGKILDGRDLEASSNQYISIPHDSSLQFTNKFSTSLWIKAESIESGGNGILNKGTFSNSQGDWALLVDANTGQNNFRFRIGLSANTAHGSTVVVPDTWYYVTTTYDGSNMKLYVNGILDGSHAYTNNVATTSNPFIIGGYYSSSYTWDGIIDEVMIFNSTLTQAEISELHNGAKAQFRVNNLGENCTLRYYGNSEATSTSSASNTYFNPIASYYLDANANDFVGSNHGTVNGATLSSGYINGSYDFDGTDDYIDIGSSGNFNLGNSKVSIVSWFNGDIFGGGGLDNILLSNNIGAINGNFDFKANSGTTNQPQVFLRGSSSLILQSNQTVNTGTWYMLTYTRDGSSHKLYLNNQLVATGINSQLIDETKNLLIGKLPAASGREFDGKIDEIYIYDNKALTPTQIYQLYTQTAPNFIEGEEQSSAIGPVITLLSPEDNYKNISKEVEFIGYVEKDIVNVSLIIDGEYDQTNTSGLNGTNYTFTRTFTNGIYNWAYEACDNESQCTISKSRTLTIFDYVELNSPTDNSISYVQPRTFNASLTASDGLLLQNASLYTNETGIWEVRNISYPTTNTSTETWDRIITEAIIWNVETCFNDSTCYFAPNNYTSFIDKQGPVINITIPNNETYNLDYYNITYPIINLTLAVEDNNFESIWYEYNDTNITIGSVSGNYSLLFQADNETGVKVWSNDTLGNINGETGYWFYHITVENTTTFNTSCEDSKINWTNLPDGIYEYNTTTCNIYDYCNNTETRTVTIDTVDPIIEYTTNSDITNTTGNFSNKDFIFVNVSAYDLNEKNITFSIRTSLGNYNTQVFTDGTRNLTWSNLPENMYFWKVTICDKANRCSVTDERIYGVEHTNITLDLAVESLIAEIGTPVLINATNDLSNVSVDIDHPEYGINYISNLFKVGFDLLINYFVKYEFSPGLDTISLNTNGSFSLYMHRFDEIKAVEFDMNGTNITDIHFYNENNELERYFPGTLNNGILYQDNLWYNNENVKTQELLFDNLGKKPIYFYIDDNAELTNFSFNITGSEYGFSVEDNVMSNYDTILTDSRVFLNNILPLQTDFMTEQFEGFNAALNTTYWSISDNYYDDGEDSQGVDVNFEETRTNTISGGKLTMFSELDNNLDEDEHDSATIYNSLKITNYSYFNIWSNENTVFTMDYLLYADERNSYDESDAVVNLYIGDIKVWESYKIENLADDDSTASSTLLEFNMTKDYENNRLLINITGVETMTYHNDFCGNVVVTRDWTNNVQSSQSSNPSCAWSWYLPEIELTGNLGNLSQPFEIETDIHGDAERSPIQEIYTCVGNGEKDALGSDIPIDWEGKDDNQIYNYGCSFINNVPNNDRPGYCDSSFTGDGYDTGTCLINTKEATYSSGTELVQATVHIYDISRTIGKIDRSDYVSNSVYNSPSNVNDLFMTFGGIGGVEPRVSTDNWEHSQQILPDGTEMAILYPGRTVRWGVYFSEEAEYSPFIPIITNIHIWTPLSTPENISIDIGGTGTMDYSMSGVLGSGNIININDFNLTSILTSSNKIGKHTKRVPIYFHSDSAGVINITEFNADYNPNPIQLNHTSIQAYLNSLNSTSFVDIPFNVTADFGSNNLILFNPVIKYLGGNSIIEVKAHNLDYTQNKSLFVDYYYSRWDYVFGIPYEFLYFQPFTGKDQEVSAYGQTYLLPIFNITNYGYANKSSNLSISLVGGLDCAETRVSTTPNYNESVIIDSNWTNLAKTDYLNTTSIWMWKDYNCTNNYWMNEEFDLYFRQCISGGVCDTKLV